MLFENRMFIGNAKALILLWFCCSKQILSWSPVPLRTSELLVYRFKQGIVNEQARNCLNYKISQVTFQLSATSVNSRQEVSSPISFNAIKGVNALVVGGSGRVGGSVVVQLVKRGAAKVTVGGTSRDSFEKSLKRWIALWPDIFPTTTILDFVALNREDSSTVAQVLQSPIKYDIVIHTAGPFQGKVKTTNGVLEACVQQNVPYIDVCDDYCTAMAAKSNYANKTNVPCIVSTGCWPGVSSLMAKQLVDLHLKQNQNNSPSDLTMKYSFFTAGSGGAGSTLLVATFLILSEKALAIRNGRRIEIPAMQEYDQVNFGTVVGDKDVAHLNLLETASIFDNLGVANIETKFGTAPSFWNTLLGLMAKLPSDLLANEPLMTKLALFSLPLVRIVDYFAGATNAMRCDVYVTDNPEINSMALYAHENLEPCVGECVVAFCAALLAGRVKPGIWFPEEAIEAGEAAAAVLKLSSVGAHTTQASGSSPCVSTASVWGIQSAYSTAN